MACMTIYYALHLLPQHPVYCPGISSCTLFTGREIEPHGTQPAACRSRNLSHYFCILYDNIAQRNKFPIEVEFKIIQNVEVGVAKVVVRHSQYIAQIHNVGVGVKMIQNVGGGRQGKFDNLKKRNHPYLLIVPPHFIH